MAGQGAYSFSFEDLPVSVQPEQVQQVTSSPLSPRSTSFDLGSSISVHAQQPSSPVSVSFEQSPDTVTLATQPTAPSSPFQPLPISFDSQTNPSASPYFAIDLSPSYSSSHTSITSSTFPHSVTDQSSPSYFPPVASPIHLSSSRIPNRREQAVKSSLPFGLIISPLAPLNPAPPILRRPAVRCSSCSSFINKFCHTNFANCSGEWKCVFCNKLNKSPEEYSDETCATFPEFTTSVVEYSDPTMQPFPSADQNAGGTYHFFLIDSNLLQEDMIFLKSSILQTCMSLPSTTRVGIITFSNVISIYALKTSNVISAHCIMPNLYGNSTHKQRDLLKNVIEQHSKYFPTVGEGMKSIEQTLEALIASGPIKRYNFQKRNFGFALETLKEILGKFTVLNKKQRISNNTGFDNELDMNVNQSDNTHKGDEIGGYVAVFMSGSPNVGPGAVLGDDATGTNGKPGPAAVETTVGGLGTGGEDAAVEFYKDLSLEYNSLNFRIDVFCVGLRNFQVKILQNLVLSNGGMIFMQKVLDSSFPKTLLLASSRVCGSQGTFSIQCSPCLSFTHIIGPAISSTSASDGPQLFKMGSVQPRTSYSLYYAIEDDIVDDYVYFQFVVKYHALGTGQIVMRVITERVDTTGNFTNWLNSIDQNVVSTLIAKKIILLSRKLDHTNLDEVIEHLDSSLTNIVSACSVLKVNTGQLDLPQEMEEIPRKLFHLRRGALISPILQHPDDIDFMRCLFLNSNFEDSVRMLVSEFYLIRIDPRAENDEKQKEEGSDTVNKGRLIRIPAEDLSLQSNFVLLMDCHTDVFIWIGKAVGENAEKLVQIGKDWFEQEGRYRIPQPKLMIFEEGSSMARCLQCRLNPAHQDSLEEQRRDFPLVNEMNEQQYADLVKKFHRTDEISYNQFYKNLLKEVQKH